MPTVHIEAKKEDIAKTVLMPGDPKRAEYIAKNYLKKAKLVNLVRGITAYTGYYKDKLIGTLNNTNKNLEYGTYTIKQTNGKKYMEM